MGWFFGSYCGCASCPKFSPPLGDELVQEYGSARWGNTKEFSSPLGVGLVHWYENIIDFKVGFRPRLGMGWFPPLSNIPSLLPSFRPRLGMGWFIFISSDFLMRKYFRPRVGMGWFSADLGYFNCELQFSSPLGDGLVRRQCQRRT